MLSSQNIREKTVQERMGEALARIPQYCPEWTNYNASDPGITILEDLTVANSLMADAISRTPYSAQRKLLKLVGIMPQKARPAKALISATNVKEPLLLPVNQKLRVGDLIFETAKLTEVTGGRITGVFRKRGDRYENISFVTDRETDVPAYLFTEKPMEGDEVYLILDSLPPTGTDFICYAELLQQKSRTPLLERDDNIFAHIEWEYYTKAGFSPIHVKDYTGCFLSSGEIRMRIPAEGAALFSGAPMEGYCIRGRLEKADYDVCPKLTVFEGFLFEAVQKETVSFCHTFQKPTAVNVYSEMAEEGYVHVFGKEEKGSSYRLYERAPAWEESGRYFEFEREGFAQTRFTFNRERYGYAPARLKNSVRVMVYSENAMRQYAVGTVLGYDMQEISLPYENIVRSNFFLIARRKDEKDGSFLYDFARPEVSEEGALYYHLMENSGTILIEDAGDFIGAELFLGSCALTRGSEGNIQPKSSFTADHVPAGVSFFSPAGGFGGMDREPFEKMRQRFRKDVREPFVAVTADDYERLVRATPGLIIEKARAVMDSARNLVRIAVKPGTDEELPQLSEIYRKQIAEWMEERRLLSTRIELSGPDYVRVNVRGTVYVKHQFDNCQEQITEAIRAKLDYLHSEKNFGTPLRFDEVFHAIELLECVDFIYDLTLRPGNSLLAKSVDGDIIPGDASLCIPGDISIETINNI